MKFSLQIDIKRDETGPYFELALTKGKPIPVHVDFSPRKNIGGRSDLLARAAGIKRGMQKRVLDATAGLCRDSFHFYCLGCAVIAVERNAEIYSVVMEHATKLDHARFELHNGDAVELMPKLAPVDVVFLDPIFQEKKKASAKPGKESELLRALEQPPSPADEFKLLEAALRAARERVVVKRALQAPELADELDGRNLSELIRSRHSIKGKAVRYDVYVVKESLPQRR